jgi:SAM-dependent methyltransferase
MLGKIRKALLGPLPKQQEERNFWIHELGRYVQWYNGEISELYSVKPPTKTQQIVAQNEKDSAILTWFNLHQKPKYLADLELPATAFKGMRVLDVGAGPMPSGLAFEGVDLYCLDQIYDEYLKAQYPIHYYDNARFMNASSEDIPAVDGFFDAVISVNAIDHVDDLTKTSAEIKRVLKPDGKFAMHVHYHQPTDTEPIILTDEIFLSHFGWVKNLKKIAESDQKTGWTAGADEKYAVWRNF